MKFVSISKTTIEEGIIISILINEINNYYNTSNNELSEKSNKDYDYAIFMLQLCIHIAQVEVHHYNQTEFLNKS